MINSNKSKLTISDEQRSEKLSDVWDHYFKLTLSVAVALNQTDTKERSGFLQILLSCLLKGTICREVKF